MRLLFSLSPPALRVTLLVCLVGVAGVGASCAKSEGSSTTFGSGATSGLGLSGSSSGGSGFFFSGSINSSGSVLPASTCGMTCTDFPQAPIVDGNVPGSPAQVFGAASSGNQSGGPCLYEPALSSGTHPGALFPANWLRPIFEWSAASGEDVFELRMHASTETSDLVVYTSAHHWTMPKAMWTALTTNANSVPITVSIRGASSSGGAPSLGTKGDFAVAPANAAGAMIYWSTLALSQKTGTTNLQGFQVGDEGTTTALTPQQVTQPVWATGPNGLTPQAPATVTCIGCHTSTPDGNNVAFTAQWPWPNAIASVQVDGGAGAGQVGSTPTWLTSSAIDNLSPNTLDRNYLGPEAQGFGPSNNVDSIMLGVQTFSAAHFKPTDRVEITSIGASENRTDVTLPFQATGVTTQLIWIDLEFNGTTDAGRPSALQGVPNNGGWGVIARGGDSNSAATPNWSHDGNTIAYTSVKSGTADGRLTTPAAGTSADIMVVPYTNKAGGAAQAVQGASDPNVNEFYPAFSPDDSIIAYNRVDKTLEMYQQPAAEVWVTLSSGGTATRLAANDPAQCQGLTSPGVSNTWPKWAPDATTAADGKTYYWVTFSSTRSPDARDAATGKGRPQLYVAAVVKDASNVITTYPAVYLWNQDHTQNNLIPAWDNFTIGHGTTSPPPR